MAQSQLLPPELKELKERELLITEFFTSIQGESSYAGQPCFFIRLAGCHLRCVWCDTVYSFQGGTRATVDECVQRARSAGCRLVEVTGGEPLLQKAVHPLLTELCDAGFTVLLETSGAVAIDEVDRRVRRIVDWKCPGSGMSAHNCADVLRALRAGDELKLVIQDRADYEWARKFWEDHRDTLPSEVPVHFSPSFHELPFGDLAAWILADGLPVRLNLQLHKWIWDPQQKGV